ncbi:DNA polymerase III subunit delta [Candidatus Parcubacteria bacterium]|nr:MAG: DNA polymerase III subunit delta [Candidatus Parcubacteria bacterium]
MIFFYHGEDSFRAGQKIEAIVNKFREKIDPGGHNIQHLDGQEIKADDFFQAISVMGFLADKKLVVVKNIFDNKKLKDWQDSLIDFLKKQKDTPEENYIVFWQAGKADSRTKLYKALNKFKFAEEFNKLSPSELNKWILGQIKKADKTIKPSALNLLVNYVGNDLWQLNQEISKLVNYVESEITDEDVKTLVQAKIDDNIFTLIDALGNKDKSLALKLIEEKLNAGVNSQYILTMIIRQFRLIIQTKSLSRQATHSGAIAQALKLPNMIADKILKQSQKYEMDQLKKIYRHLMELDEKLKTTSQQDKILFTQMINNL